MRLDPRVLLVAAAASGFAACGGTSGTGAPSPALLQIAGSYQITPTVLQNVCGTITVLPGPAQVTQAPGAADFRLTHAGSTYTGSVQASGTFSTTPLVIPFAPGSTDTVAIAGRFTTGGLEATVTVDANHAGAPPCRYLLGWQASKQGAPNVIP